MANVKTAMEYAAKIDREAMEGRLKTTVDKNEGALYENKVRENAIVFTKEGGDWVMRITRDCISVNDNVSVDDAAQAVVTAIGRYLNKSKWVGMTEEEVNSIYKVVEKVVGEHWENGGTKLMFPFTLYEALEAKLRSRNGG